MRWHIENRATPYARRVADRHYNRQKIGTYQFAPPGRCLVLAIPGAALWVTSWQGFVKHAWGGAWVCSAFRNERPDLYRSSDLVREAVAATRWRWPSVPDLGMVTFVDERKVRRKRDPGRCFTRAGFESLREYDVDAGAFQSLRTVTERLLVFAIDVGRMPDPEMPIGAPVTMPW